MRGSTSAPSPTPEKKLTDLHDLQKWVEKMWGGDLSYPSAQPLTDIKLIKVGFICVAVTKEYRFTFRSTYCYSNMTEIFVDSQVN